MFGFQRVGDLAWAAADSRARGFLVGATAGRTTLAGEGLQHQDGSSHLIASTIPNCVAYDPCYGYELGVILQDGMRRMLDARDDVFYYVTVANENYQQPALPAGAEEGIRRGMHRVRKSAQARVQLLGSGPILREALAAAEMLEQQWSIGADVWSVTSFTELRRDGMDVSRRIRLDADAGATSYVEQCLGSTSGPVIATSDYVSALPDLIRPWVPRRYTVLGTDGFGRSDTRVALRQFFEVDRKAIALAALAALAEEKVVSEATLASARTSLGVDPRKPNPWSS
jgi:pyruvate dehydrogenase E1 component